MKKPKIPTELHEAGRRLWRQITDEYEVLDSGGQAHLLAACSAEDDIQTMRAIVTREGLVCAKDPSKPHPLLAAIRGSEGVRRSSLRALNLDIGESNPVGRPPGT